jgi:epoxyqueuosine reductase QueG
MLVCTTLLGTRMIVGLEVQQPSANSLGRCQKCPIPCPSSSMRQPGV